MYQSSLAATLHGWGAFFLGLWFLNRDRQPVRVIYAAGYIVGAEVLWRMTEAGVFWEFGKYAVSLLFILAILKWRLRLRAMPLFYFILLLPSALITLDELTLSTARGQISFNLSGPLSLALAALVFSQIRLSRLQLRYLLLFTMMPIVGIAFLALYSTVAATSLQLTLESNDIMSGGFGPNQVSAALALGALAGWLYILLLEKASKQQWMILGLTIWFLIHAVLTFSRGGALTFIITAPIATIYLIQRRPKSLRRLVTTMLVAVGILSLSLPYLNAFTSGFLLKRYTQPTTTNRLEFWRADLRTWSQNFWVGVGPGMAKQYRASVTGTGTAAAAHTEFTRLLAEHGILGLWSLLLLFGMLVGALPRAHHPHVKGLILALMGWSLVEMSHAAMRLVAMSFVYALPFSLLWWGELVQVQDEE